MAPQLVHITRDGAPRQEKKATIWGCGPEGLESVAGVYVHVPFCFHKCHYCDFYSIVDDERHESFAERLIVEAGALGEVLNHRLETLFVGGGTPTLLADHLWKPILERLNDCLQWEAGREFTVEANPETVTPAIMRTLTDGGVNRVSIGAQTFDSAHLTTLERHHDPANVARAVAVARDAGIDNINLDLICAIPGQTIDDVRRDLEAALALRPDHVSYYTLIYEPNTPLRRKLERGQFAAVSEELEVEMYCEVAQTLASAGFEHYEISNWCRPGHRCQHNLVYWTNRSWWPLGPSASGHLNGLRWKNTPRLASYLAEEPWPGVCEVERLGADGRIGEALMLRLRLLDGIPRPELHRLLEEDESDRHVTIDRLLEDGQLEWSDDRLRLTRGALLVADSVIAALL